MRGNYTVVQWFYSYNFSKSITHSDWLNSIVAVKSNHKEKEIRAQELCNLPGWIRTCFIGKENKFKLEHHDVCMCVHTYRTFLGSCKANHDMFECSHVFVYENEIMEIYETVCALNL